MGILTWWPLALLVLVPGIILLYILKQEAKPHPFSSVMLWEEALQNIQATKPWEKLRKHLLMLLQILAVLLFILAMMEPWLSVGGTSRQAVLVIDNSASMDTLYDEDETRLEAAKAEACDYVDTLPADCVLHVIAGNERASLLVSNSSDRQLVKERIQEIEQTGLAGDLSTALGLAESCASQNENSEIVFFTDTAFDPGDLKASVVSFYSEAENLSLEQVSYAWKEEGTVLQAMVRLTNHGGESHTGEINLYGQGDGGEETLLDIGAFEVAPGESQSVYFELDENQWQGLSALKAELNGQDGLDGDNRTWCVLGTDQTRRVLLLTESNLFVEKALSTLAGVDVYRTSDPAVITAESDYDLYIFDGIVPDTLPVGGSFLFIHCEDEAIFTSADELEGLRLTLADSEASAYVAGTEIGVNASYIYALPLWGTSFIMPKNGYDGGDPGVIYSAGFYGLYDGHRIAVMGFDMHETDFGLQAEFPVLISNLADYLLGSRLVEKNSYTSGDGVTLYGSTGGGELLLRLPDGSEERMAADEAYGIDRETVEPGIYQVSQTVGEQESKSFFAVNFPWEMESDVQPASTMTEAADGNLAVTGGGALSLRGFLLALLLILLLAEAIIYGRTALRKRWSSRFWGEIALRGLVFLLVILAFFGISIRKSSPMTTTIFVMDMSDSCKVSWQEETDFVRSAIQDMPSGNQAGIVVFGQDARIEQFVSEKKAFTEVQSTVTASATNLEQAVQTAMALFPEETAKRLVLLTDGAENEGNLTGLAAGLAGSDMELKVIRYDSSMAAEVYVSDVSLPETIAEGDQFQVEVTVESSSATHAVVSLYSGKTLKGQKEVNLQKGSNQLVFADEGVESGIKRYRVTVEADQDTVTVNNAYSAYTTVTAKPRILLVEGSRDEGGEFARLLEACGYDYDVVTPTGVPVNVTDMLQYQSVILLNVYGDDLRTGFMDTLESYVKDYAGGLICIGGDNSYALGNYRNTPLETVLPVKMDLEGEKEVPSIAMVMVIDHSGSMASPSTERGNISCMDVAKQAAVNALDSLREIDEIGVVAFDDTYTWAVPLQKATDIDGVTERIGGIYANGGTSIYPALEAAVQGLMESDAALKHIVLLTDGQDGYQAYEPLLEEMNDQGITLSTVAVGTGADTNTLSWLAEAGQGRYYYSDAGSGLPRIFAQEVYLSTKSYLINEEFTPVIVNSHEIIQGIFDKGSPSLLGYIAATAKPAATTLLESAREDPILTVWQYGLGRSVAWMSDGTNEWTGNMAVWDGYTALWRNIIDWTIVDTSVGDDILTVEQQASKAVVTYQTENYTGDTQVTAVLTDEAGAQQEITLHAVSPGVYKGEADLAETGVYSINLRNQNGPDVIKSINTAVAMQYSREYRYGDVSNCLDSFTAQASGRFITSPREVFDTRLKGAVVRTDLSIWFLLAAVLFFMADVVCRRLSIDWLGAVSRGIMGIKGKAGAAGAGKGRLHRRAAGTDRSSGYGNGDGKGRRFGAGKEPGAGNVGGAGDGDGEGRPAGSAGSVKSSEKALKEEAKDQGRSSAAKETRRPHEKRRTKASEQQTAVIDTAALLKKKKDRDI